MVHLLFVLSYHSKVQIVRYWIGLHCLWGSTSNYKLWWSKRKFRHNIYCFSLKNWFSFGSKKFFLRIFPRSFSTPDIIFPTNRNIYLLCVLSYSCTLVKKVDILSWSISHWLSGGCNFSDNWFSSLYSFHSMASKVVYQIGLLYLIRIIVKL